MQTVEVFFSKKGKGHQDLTQAFISNFNVIIKDGVPLRFSVDELPFVLFFILKTFPHLASELYQKLAYVVMSSQSIFPIVQLADHSLFHPQSHQVLNF